MLPATVPFPLITWWTTGCSWKPIEQLERLTTHLIAAYRMRRGGGGMERGPS